MKPVKSAGKGVTCAIRKQMQQSEGKRCHSETNGAITKRGKNAKGEGTNFRPSGYFSLHVVTAAYVHLQS